jgi:hypothetical protein
MTSKEFVIWFKGFTEGVHEYNVTPKQWDLLKAKIEEVDDNTIPIGGVIVDHNTFKVNDPGFYQTPNPHGTVYPNWTGINPYGITTGPNTNITTTPGSNSITFSSGSSNWLSTNTNQNLDND